MRKTVVTIEDEATFTTTRRTATLMSGKAQFHHSGNVIRKASAIKERGATGRLAGLTKVTTVTEVITITDGEAICAPEAI